MHERGDFKVKTCSGGNYEILISNQFLGIFAELFLIINILLNKMGKFPPLTVFTLKSPDFAYISLGGCR